MIINRVIRFCLTPGFTSYPLSLFSWQCSSVTRD